MRLGTWNSQRCARARRRPYGIRDRFDCCECSCGWFQMITLRRLLLLLFLLCYASVGTAQAQGTFEPGGNMTTPRSGHTATLLLNGQVLITGGSKERPASAELFDPVTNTFVPTGNMTTGRFGNSATLLPDGRVLIVGGYYL